MAIDYTGHENALRFFAQGADIFLAAFASVTCGYRAG
jgi:hypothetical protein